MLPDEQQLLTDDQETVLKTTVPRQGPLGRLFRRDTVWLLFPAKLYCGQSLVDATYRCLGYTSNASGAWV